MSSSLNPKQYRKALDALFDWDPANPTSYIATHSRYHNPELNVETHYTKYDKRTRLFKNLLQEARDDIERKEPIHQVEAIQDLNQRLGRALGSDQVIAIEAFKAHFWNGTVPSFPSAPMSRILPILDSSLQTDSQKDEPHPTKPLLDWVEESFHVEILPNHDRLVVLVRDKDGVPVDDELAEFIVERISRKMPRATATWVSQLADNPASLLGCRLGQDGVFRHYVSLIQIARQAISLDAVVHPPYAVRNDPNVEQAERYLNVLSNGLTTPCLHQSHTNSERNPMVGLAHNRASLAQALFITIWYQQTLFQQLETPDLCERTMRRYQQQMDLVQIYSSLNLSGLAMTLGFPPNIVFEACLYAHSTFWLYVARPIHVQVRHEGESPYFPFPHTVYTDERIAPFLGFPVNEMMSHSHGSETYEALGAFVSLKETIGWTFQTAISGSSWYLLHVWLNDGQRVQGFNYPVNRQTEVRQYYNVVKRFFARTRLFTFLEEVPSVNESFLLTWLQIMGAQESEVPE